MPPRATSQGPARRTNRGARVTRRAARAGRWLLLLGALTPAAAGCRGWRGERGGPAPAAARGVSFERCARIEPGAAGERETRAVRGRSLAREGVIVRDPRPPRASGDGAVLALLGGPHDGDPGDPRLGAIAAAVRDADLVVVVGGLHGDAARLGAFADAVLPAGTPALLVPADTERLPAFRAAVSALAARRPELLDGTRARAVLAADLEVVTVPGTPWPALLRARGEGCGRLPEDLDALARALPRPAAPRVVVSAHAPAQRGGAAIDRGVLGTHVGDAALAAALDALGARGVAALVPRESAGTLGDLAGGRALSPDAELGDTRFALSLGSAGSDPSRTLEGALRGPLAWRVHVGRGGGVRVEPVAP